jgi:hypothetical protein
MKREQRHGITATVKKRATRRAFSLRVMPNSREEMKIGWIALCLVAVLAGCGRKETPPVAIRIVRDGATEVDGVRRTPRELQVSGSRLNNQQ